MSDMMTKKTFLDVCKSIEGLCAELYHYYSHIYADVPEASALWRKAALEEENHQRQFNLAIRTCDGTEFEINDDGLKRAYSVQHKLLELTDHIKSNKPDLLHAVSNAVRMEEQLADLHAHSSLKFKEESMQKLFRALYDADRGHIADLRQYLTVLSLPKSEMTG
jgi:hypothetical protein